MDVNQLFASAEAAFGQRNYVEARRLLNAVRAAAGEHEAVLHLLALVERRAGNPQAAEAAFRAALRQAPRDPQINNNYANFLDEQGRPDEAMRHYDLALGANARFADARLNRGLLRQKLGRLEEALADVDAAIAAGGGSARAQSARGSLLRQLECLADAAAAYDAALVSVPDHAKALEGRARVALERGESGAVARFRHALAAQPDKPELIMGLAEALEAEEEGKALPYLAAAVAARPDWTAGQERLAEMRTEAGDPGEFDRGFARALAARPGDLALHVSHWRALALAGRHKDALEALDRAGLPENRNIRLMRAVFAGEAGEPARALDLLAALGDGPDVQTVRARALLRLGDFRRAAELFEEVTDRQPTDIAGWAHLGLAWRKLGDARHEWLCGQAELWAHADLDLDERELAALAERLRGLHRTRAHPIGQSLRGGTQTRGRLFWRDEPEIARLRTAIGAAINRYADRLPHADARHPLLRHRDARLTFAGSWSVRLMSSGFHVSHIHPEGVLSSACYVALPPGVGQDNKDKEGWLELGRPPGELGLDLEPLDTIRPRAGRLALFPSYLYHGTRPFASGERLTVAFDIAAR